MLLHHQVAYQASVGAINTLHQPKNAVQVKQATVLGKSKGGHVTNQGDPCQNTVASRHTGLPPRPQVVVGLQSHAGL